MAVGIVDEDIVKVREATDLVGLISQYVQLRRVGQRWTGLCPFHNEKTPSFSVDAASGLYHCFGCKASGDAITFIREREQTDFVGALEILANRAGIQLRYTDRAEGESRKKQARLYAELERACDWYHDRLRSAPDAAAARGYLRSRGFSSDEVAHFRIGWAPDGWDLLARDLKLSAADATDSGLGFVNKAGRLQDFFRSRVLFPIVDERSRVIGFGGRKLPDADGPKYKNSRDNAVYHKSRALYGLNWAKAQAVEHDQIVVCEGYTDVIGFARAGVTRAVATCGTALTEDHVKALKRFSRRIVLAYDADEAGQSAADRVYAWERTHDVEVSVVSLPAGTDPYELASKDPNKLSAAVDEARPFLQFRVDRVLARGDLGSVEGRSRAAEDALSVVAEHPDAFVRDQYLMQIADQCRVDIDLLRHSGGDRGSRRGSDAPRRTMKDRQDRGRIQRSDIRSNRSSATRQSSAVELEVLKLYISHPEHVEPLLVAEMFSDGVAREAFVMLRSHVDLVAARDASPPDVAELLARLAVDGTVADTKDVLTRLATEVGRAVMADLEAQARSSADPLDYVEAITWLKLSLDSLRSSKVEGEKLTQLLVWLAEQRVEAERG